MDLEDKKVRIGLNSEACTWYLNVPVFKIGARSKHNFLFMKLKKIIFFFPGAF